MIGGSVLTGARGIGYESSQDKELIYGKGNLPQAIGRGNKSFQGEITVLQTDLETLIAVAPNNDLNDHRGLGIVVSYQKENGDVVTDSLVGVEFNNVNKNFKQADKFMEVSLPIIFLKVNYNV